MPDTCQTNKHHKPAVHLVAPTCNGDSVEFDIELISQDRESVIQVLFDSHLSLTSVAGNGDCFFSCLYISGFGDSPSSIRTECVNGVEKDSVFTLFQICSNSATEGCTYTDEKIVEALRKYPVTPIDSEQRPSLSSRMYDEYSTLMKTPTIHADFLVIASAAVQFNVVS